jgi:hypothetical protein
VSDHLQVACLPVRVCWSDCVCERERCKGGEVCVCVCVWIMCVCWIISPGCAPPYLSGVCVCVCCISWLVACSVVVSLDWGVVCGPVTRELESGVQSFNYGKDTHTYSLSLTHTCIRHTCTLYLSHTHTCIRHTHTHSISLSLTHTHAYDTHTHIYTLSHTYTHTHIYIYTYNYQTLTADNRTRLKTASRSPRCMSSAPVALLFCCLCVCARVCASGWLVGGMGMIRDEKAGLRSTHTHRNTETQKHTNTHTHRHTQTHTQRTEPAEVFDGLDVRAEEALHLWVHNFDRHLLVLLCVLCVCCCVCVCDFFFFFFIKKKKKKLIVMLFCFCYCTIGVCVSVWSVDAWC